MHTLTNHAKKRMQQRGIKRQVIETLYEFGKERPSHHGASIIYLDKAAIQTISQVESKATCRYLAEKSVYLIVKDGLIITVGHRYKKIRRN